VQLAADEHVDANVERAEIGVRDAAARGARLIALPEKWNVIGERDVLEAGAEPIDGPTLTRVRAWARELDVWILAGSIVVREPGAAKLSNLSVLVDPTGAIRARYAKMHMFDVDVAGVAYRESDAEDPGSELVVADVDGIPVGMTVCYDLRFPELFRLLALRGARILTVPAAFTLMTGRDHWEVLLRARAIENQCFVLAPDIIGDHGAGKISYGGSMIVDPWGTVIARAPDAECAIVADLDLGAVDRVRAAIPSLANRRGDVYSLSERTPSTT
jgi:predicted amidohydrolase